MPNGNIVAIVLSMICLPTNSSAQGKTPGEILKEVTATYESLQTYKATGNIVADIFAGNEKTSIEMSFSLLLMKPNRYLVSWTQKSLSMADMAQGGAVWSDGSQPYLYIGKVKAYSKMSSDEFALAGATGISGGAAWTIPSLFFKWRSAPFARLKDLKVEKTEQVGEEDCYVISGESTVQLPTMNQSSQIVMVIQEAAKKETFWISKSSHLIVKYAISLESNQENAVGPDMTDEQLDEAIKVAGQRVTEESRKNMREMMNKLPLLKNIKIRVSSTETHAKISSPDLIKTDFRFVLPNDAVMNDSLNRARRPGRSPEP